MSNEDWARRKFKRLTALITGLFAAALIVALAGPSIASTLSSDTTADVASAMISTGSVKVQGQGTSTRHDATQARAAAASAAEAKAAAEALARHKNHLAHLAQVAAQQARAKAAAAVSAAAKEAAKAPIKAATAPAVTATAEPMTQTPAAPAVSGTYSYSALEQLWISQGGRSSAAPTAACIAEHESGGNPNAVSPTNDYGLWQINGSNGSLATLNPQGNARSAIILSDNGSNWSAWTTHSSCGV